PNRLHEIGPTGAAVARDAVDRTRLIPSHHSDDGVLVVRHDGIGRRSRAVTAARGVRDDIHRAGLSDVLELQDMHVVRARTAAGTVVNGHGNGVRSAQAVLHKGVADRDVWLLAGATDLVLVRGVAVGRAGLVIRARKSRRPSGRGFDRDDDGIAYG